MSVGRDMVGVLRRHKVEDSFLKQKIVVINGAIVVHQISKWRWVMWLSAGQAGRRIPRIGASNSERPLLSWREA